MPQKIRLVSVRRNFSSSIFFGPETWCDEPWIEGDRPMPGCEWTWYGSSPARPCLDAVLARWAGIRKVLVLVHGYNSNVERSRRAYREIVGSLPADYDAVVGFLWPGSNTVFGYWTAWLRARKAGEKLADLLVRMRQAGIERIDLNGHSMGCAVILKALGTELADLVILNGPAVDRDALADGGEFRSSLFRARRMLISWSRTDPALSIGGILARWREAPMGAMGPLFENGVPMHVRLLDLTGSVIDHGSYRKCGAVLEAWRQADQELKTES